MKLPVALLRQVTSCFQADNVDGLMQLFELNPLLYSYRGHGNQSELHNAAGHYSPRCLAALVELNRFDLEEQTDYGRTALHLAALRNSSEGTESCRLLLDAGANIHHRNKVGATPLHSAVFGGNLDTIKLLVERGADINAHYGNPPFTPLDQAYQGGMVGTDHRPVIAYLESIGAKRGERPETFLDPATFPALFQEFMDERHETVTIDAAALGMALPEGVSLRRYTEDLEQRHVVYTVGCSRHRQPTEHPKSWYRFLEFCVALPLDWPLDETALQDPRNAWPLHWLVTLAGHDFGDQPWFGKPGIPVSGAPWSDLARSRLSLDKGYPGFAAGLLLEWDETAQHLTLDHNHGITVLTLLPLFIEEARYAANQGLESLLKDLTTYQASLVLQRNRLTAGLERPHREALEGIKDVLEKHDIDWWAFGERRLIAPGAAHHLDVPPEEALAWSQTLQSQLQAADRRGAKREELWSLLQTLAG